MPEPLKWEISVAGSRRLRLDRHRNAMAFRDYRGPTSQRRGWTAVIDGTHRSHGYERVVGYFSSRQEAMMFIERFVRAVGRGCAPERGSL